ncbi:nuclear transport factor 2 family protein [Plastoroseomonas arctica]|uniref:Nuclear transport factor 2 family protein n=1 Tax=Plastoroseomonas arctica TaxID=1509237 RepID=A0AAF1K475_9PROT|nr:nuclear transport factor 2 family protein [Plastoroseomonas arctica]MBR0655941.1 nuclear transport factor 2 family protein [Plastoroseomonas arctica]
MNTTARRTLAIAGLGTIIAAKAIAQADEAAAVAAQVEALRTAMIAADRPRLEALSASALSYGHSAGRIENKAQFVSNLVESRAPFRSITLSDQTVAIDGPNAIVRHTFAAEQGGATPSSVRIGVLQVWTKQGAEWKLLARQAFRT